jgi:HEAT repeat protein
MRRPLVAAGALAVVDAVAAGHAWLPWSDRLALAAALACGFAGLGALAWGWAGLVKRPLLAAAPLLIAVAFALASTATAQRTLGWAAAPLLLMMGTGLFLAGARLPPAIRIAIGVACVVALAMQPMRASAPLRLWLASAGFLAIAGATRPERPLRWLAAGAIGCAAAFALLHVSSNVRFVAARRTAIASLLFDAAARAPSRIATAQASAPARAIDAAPLADAHLLLITVDALRADHPLASANRGLRFTRAYAQAPHTAFSITSILTGYQPDRLADAPPTLADLLRARRWETEAFYPAGLFFDGRGALEPYARRRFGFEWVDSRTQDAHALTDAVLARLDALVATGEPRGLFWVHYFDPHEPYEAHGLPAGALPRERYDAEVRFTDGEIARLVDGFRALTRPTLVVVTADHGEEFGEHGGAYHGTSLYDEQLRVPLAIFALGAGLNGGERSTPVELVDLFPTFGELLGVALPAGDGASLYGEKERDAHAAVSTQRMLLRGSWKLIHDLRGDVDELYDLAGDPGEQRNRADAEPQRLAELRRALEDWFAVPTTEALIARLRNERSFRNSERAAAARALAEREAAIARPALRAALTDAPEVAAEAAFALSTLADAAALPTLEKLVDQPAYRVRAALALGRLRSPAGVPALRELTQQLDVTTRRHAIHFLGLLDGAASVPRLIQLATDDLKVRGEAYLALGRITGRVHSPDAERFLLERMSAEDYEDARAQLAWAVAVAGMNVHSVIVWLLDAAAAGLPNAGEALVRLRAPGAADFACEKRDCDTCFASVTSCRGEHFTTTTSVDFDGPALAIVRGRALGDGADLALRVGGAPIGSVHLTARMNEQRVPLTLRRGRVAIELTGGPAELDHLLLVPSP